MVKRSALTRVIAAVSAGRDPCRCDEPHCPLVLELETSHLMGQNMTEGEMTPYYLKLPFNNPL